MSHRQHPVSDGEAQRHPWHQALAYALLGRRCPDLGDDQARPDVAVVAAWLEDHGLVEQAHRLASAPRSAEHPWPVPVPPDLHVPPAQWAAALFELRRRLGLLGVATRPATDRPLDADELRLLREVPPHHGS